MPTPRQDIGYANHQLILGIKIRRITRRYANRLAVANHALQIGQLQHSLKENLPKELYACAVVDESTGKSLEFRHLIKMDKYGDVWMHSLANELGRLAQGIRTIKGMDTIECILLSSVPKGETVTYSRIVCKFRPQKDEQHRKRLTAGGNLIVCLYEVSTPTASIITNKLLLNSVISTPGARFHGMDIIVFTSTQSFPSPDI